MTRNRSDVIRSVLLPGLVGSLALAAAVLASGSVSAQDRGTPFGEWRYWGADAWSTRYSPVDQINGDNFDDLEQAWVWRGDNFGPGVDYILRATPIYVGGKLFTVAGQSRTVVALDPETGESLWLYREPHTTRWKRSSRKSHGKGVAYGEIDGRGVIYLVTPAFFLHALDAETGRPIEGFGNPVPLDGFEEGGTVDLLADLGHPYDPDYGIPDSIGYITNTSPPIVVNGVVLMGNSNLTGRLDTRQENVPGDILAYDTRTGDFKWRFHVVPRPGEVGHETWENDAWQTIGDVSSWAPMSADPELGLVYIVTNGATIDYYGGHHPGDNLFSTSIIALDVETGLPKWHFQTAHKDVWDYDPGSQPTLIDFPTDNGKVPALVMPTKQGEIYVFNRETGELLGGGAEERPVPQGGAEPEQRSKTQPFSLYATLRQPDIDEKDMWGMTPFDQLFCRIQYHQASWKGMYTPPTAEQPWIQYTGYNGGSDWGSVAIDPRRGVIIANYNDMPNYNELVPRDVANKLGWVPREEQQEDSGGAEGAGDPQANTPYAINVNAGWRVPYTGMLCKQPPYGHIRAIDLASGDTLWDRPLGTARANGPWGIRSGLPIDIGTPNNGGSVVTAGGLIFIAAATDDLIRAIDIESGETVWQAALPAGGQANPMVYEANGRQYVVIVATGHHFMETPSGDYVIAYALPKSDDS